MATRFLRSSTFRLALLYMLLFSTSVLMLLGFIYWSTVSYISAQTDETIDIEILDLTERYRNAGLSGLTQLLSERLSRRPAGASVYLLTDKDLAPLVGNLDRWPLGADIKASYCWSAGISTTSKSPNAALSPPCCGAWPSCWCSAVSAVS